MGKGKEMNYARSPMYILLFFASCLSLVVCAEEPWGKDADMVMRSEVNFVTPIPYCPTPVLGPFAEYMIRFHQEVISPCDGPRSHYKPSSSQYTLDAMCKYGFLTGMAYGCDRLMRENKEKWVYRVTVDNVGKPIKYDPVP